MESSVREGDNWGVVERKRDQRQGEWAAQRLFHGSRVEGGNQAGRVGERREEVRTLEIVLGAHVTAHLMK